MRKLMTATSIDYSSAATSFAKLSKSLKELAASIGKATSK